MALRGDQFNNSETKRDFNPNNDRFWCLLEWVNVPSIVRLKQVTKKFSEFCERYYAAPFVGAKEFEAACEDLNKKDCRSAFQRLSLVGEIDDIIKQLISEEGLTAA